MVHTEYNNYILKTDAIRHGQEKIMYQQVVTITPNCKHMPLYITTWCTACNIMSLFIYPAGCEYIREHSGFTNHPLLVSVIEKMKVVLILVATVICLTEATVSD